MSYPIYHPPTNCRRSSASDSENDDEDMKKAIEESLRVQREVKSSCRRSSAPSPYDRANDDLLKAMANSPLSENDAEKDDKDMQKAIAESRREQRQDKGSESDKEDVWEQKTRAQREWRERGPRPDALEESQMQMATAATLRPKNILNEAEQLQMAMAASIATHDDEEAERAEKAEKAKKVRIAEIMRGFEKERAAIEKATKKARKAAERANGKRPKSRAEVSRDDDVEYDSDYVDENGAGPAPKPTRVIAAPTAAPTKSAAAPKAATSADDLAQARKSELDARKRVEEVRERMNREVAEAMDAHLKAIDALAAAAAQVSASALPQPTSTASKSKAKKRQPCSDSEDSGSETKKRRRVTWARRIESSCEETSSKPSHSDSE